MLEALDSNISKTTDNFRVWEYTPVFIIIIVCFFIIFLIGKQFYDPRRCIPFKMGSSLAHTRPDISYRGDKNMAKLLPS